MQHPIIDKNKLIDELDHNGSVKTEDTKSVNV